MSIISYIVVGIIIGFCILALFSANDKSGGDSDE